MEGFYVDSHGSLYHSEIEHILCFKGIIFTVINLWSTHMLPMESNIATYNLYGGGLDAQVAPSVVKFNTIPRCHEVQVSNIHVVPKYNSTDGSTKRKRKHCVGFIKRLFKRSKANIKWLTVYVNANSLKLPYDTNKNE